MSLTPSHIGNYEPAFRAFRALRCFTALLRWMMHYISMSNRIYFTRANKEKEADEGEIKSFEKSALSDFKRGKEVYIIEKFPKKFFHLATKIRIEKVVGNVSSLSPLSNSRLFQVFSANSIYG